MWKQSSYSSIGSMLIIPSKYLIIAQWNYGVGDFKCNNLA